MKTIKLEHRFNRSDFPKAKDVQIKKSDLLLYEGEAHQGNCFVLLEGKLEVRLISGNGHETLLYYLYPGELVGELAMFGERVRTATITASQDCHLLRVSYQEFSQCMRNHNFLQKVTHLFMQRYVRTHEVVCRLGQPNIGMKLCRYFKSLSDQHKIEDACIKLHLPSHSEMGKLLSCQRETITREIKKLVAMGVIEPCDHSSCILNRKKVHLFLADMLD
ncbi:MAG: Crp/Fnr family transcriptional regulator [Mariprofundaceae bacterium]|nr:Crp/Fnr family transcriptional regulator [Mariprofundaceae bacterium]